MIYLNVQGETQPAAVTKTVRDGVATVVLVKNIATEDDQESGRSYYRYDECDFVLPADRDDTESDILSSFDGWWEYGAQPEPDEMTLEERVAELEAFVIEIAGGGI